MSDRIEERIVSMKFNNDEFESNARDTIETLERLDHSIAEVSNGKKHGSAFDALTNSVKTTSRAFSSFKKIAEGALQKIGWDGIDFIRRNMTSLFKEATGMNNMIAGWSKYGQEVESVQTIMNATGKTMDEVQASLDKISWFTDETSYQYDSMVANIGRFNAAGVSLEDAEQTMLGIASAAGYFGVNASKATHAMSGFASAIGKGKMDRLAWSWIETAGMNVEGLQQAFMDTAVEMGIFTKVGDKLYRTMKGNDYAVGQFRNSLSEDWLTTEVMTKTLNKYSKSIDTIYEKYQEFGGNKTTSDIIEELGDSLDETSRKAFRAAQEAKTFRDAWDSVTVAIQSKWRESFRHIVGNYEQAKQLWTAVANELYDVFAASGDVRNEMLKTWSESGGRDSLLRALENVWKGIRGILDPIKNAFETVFPPMTAERLKEITEKFENLTYKFRSLFDVDAVEFVETTDTIAKAAEKVIGPVERTTEVLDDLAMAVIRGDWGNGADRFNSLVEAGYSYELVQNRVNGLMNELYGTNYDPNYYTVPADAIATASEEAAEAIDEETEAAKNQVRVISDDLLGGTRVYTEEEQKLVDQHERARKNADRLTGIFGGLAAAVKIVGRAFNELRGRLGELIESAFGGFGPVVEKAIDALADFGWKMMGIEKNFKEPEWADKFFNTIRNSVGKVSKFLGDLTLQVIEFAKIWLPRAKTWILEHAGTIFNTLSGWFTTIYGAAKQYVPVVFEWLKTNISTFWESIKNGEGIKRLGEIIKDLGEKFKIAGMTGFGVLGEAISKLFGSSKEGETFGERFAGFIDGIAGSISGLYDWITNAIGAVKDFFKSFDSKGAQTATDLSLSMETNIGGLLEAIGKLDLGYIKDFFTKILGMIDSVTAWARDPLGAFVGKIDEFANKIGEFFQSITLENVGEKLKGTALGLFLLTLATNIAKGVKKITNLPGTFVAVLTSIKDVLTAYQQNLNGYALLTTAKAIGLLTLSVIGLSFIDSDKLTDVAVSLGALMITFGFAVKMMSLWNAAQSKLQDSRNKKLGLENANKALENEKEKIKQGTTLMDNISKQIMAPFNNFQKQLNASIDKKLNANNWAKGLLLMAVALGILWHQVITPIYEFFKEAPEVDRQRMIEVTGIIAGAVLGFVAIMTIANHFSGKASVGSALSYVGVAAAMWLLLKALEGIKDYSPDQLSNVQNVMWALAGVVAALGYAIGTITKNSYTEKFESQTWKSTYGATQTATDLIKVFLGLAAMVRLMMPAFETIGGMEPADLGKVGLVFLSLLGTMALIVKITGKMKTFKTEELKKRFDAMKSVITTMIGLIALTTAVGAVAGIDGALEAWGRGLVVMGVSLAAFVGASVLIEKFNVANGMEAFSKSILMFAGAILVAVGTFYLLGKAIPAVMDGIAAIGERLQDAKFMENFEKAKPVIVKAFLILLGAFATAFVIFKSGLLKKLGGIGGTILDKINTFLGGDLSSKITGLLSGLFSSIGGWLKGLWGAGGFFGKTKILFGLGLLGLFVGALIILEAACPGIADKIVKVIIRVLHAVADAIAGNASEIVGAVGHLAKALVGLLSEALHQALGGLGDLLSDVTEWDWLSKDAEWRKKGGELWDRFTGFFTGNNSKKTKEEAVRNITGNVSAARSAYNKNMGVMNRDVASGIDQVATTIQTGTVNIGNGVDLMSTLFGSGMTGMVSNASGNMYDLQSIMSTGTGEMAGIYDAYNMDLGLDVSEFSDYYGQMPDIVQENMGASAYNMQDGANNLSSIWDYLNASLAADKKSFAQDTTDVSEAFIDGLTQEQWESVLALKESLYESYREAFPDEFAAEMADREVRKYVRGLKEANNNNLEEIKDAGRFVAEGYAQGIRERIRNVEEACEAMTSSGIYITKVVQMSKSPSKVYAKLGSYAAEGYALGISNNSGLVADSAEGMVGGSIDKVREAIALASAAFAQDWQDGPVITPVLDLSSVRAGVGNLNRLTNGTSMNIAGTIGEIHTPKQAMLNKLASLEQGIGTVNAGLATAGDASLTVNVPLYMDSKEVGHATAKVVNADIEHMQRNAMRRSGKK